MKDLMGSQKQSSQTTPVWGTASSPSPAVSLVPSRKYCTGEEGPNADGQVTRFSNADIDNNGDPSCSVERSDAAIMLTADFPLWFLFPTLLLHPGLQESFHHSVSPLRRQLRRAAALRFVLLETACAEASNRRRAKAEYRVMSSPSAVRCSMAPKPLVLFKSDAAKIVQTLDSSFAELKVNLRCDSLAAHSDQVLNRNQSTLDCAQLSPAGLRRHERTCRTAWDVVEEYSNRHSSHPDREEETPVSQKRQATSLLQNRVLRTVSEELQFSQRLTAALIEALIEADCMLAEAREREKLLDREVASLSQQLQGAEKRYQELEEASAKKLAATHRRFDIKETRWINTVAHLRESLDNFRGSAR